LAKFSAVPRTSTTSSDSDIDSVVQSTEGASSPRDVDGEIDFLAVMGGRILIFSAR
jgi:hypothetical protein